MAIAIYAYIKTTLDRLVRDERAQDGFEYILVVGAITVAVIAAMITPVGTTLINAVVDGACNAMNGLPTVTVACS